MENPTAPENVQPEAELPNAGAAPAPDGASGQDQTQSQPPAEGEQEGEVDARAEKPEHRRAASRFSDLTRERNRAIEEAAYWRGVAEASRGQNARPDAVQEAPQQPQQPSDPEPNPADFVGKEYDPAYLKAIARWEGRQEVKAATQAAKTEAAREAEERVAYQRFEEGRTRFVEARQNAEAIEEQYPNYAGAVVSMFDEIARAEPPGTPNRLIDVITQSENPEWVVAALRTKDGLRQQIYSLDPVSRALAIGRIDAQISANLRASAQAARPASQSAKAPASSAQQTQVTPPAQVNGRGASPSFDPNKGSVDDYVRWRSSQN